MGIAREGCCNEVGIARNGYCREVGFAGKGSGKWWVRVAWGAETEGGVAGMETVAEGDLSGRGEGEGGYTLGGALARSGE